MTKRVKIQISIYFWIFIMKSFKYMNIDALLQWTPMDPSPGLLNVELMARHFPCYYHIILMQTADITAFSPSRFQTQKDCKWYKHLDK